jgi:argonaute-like protein implicated in RNA metabolism and viral defense
MSFTARQLRLPQFQFSPEDENAVSDDKLKGLQRFGPYRRLDGKKRFGFVFPRGYRDLANDLYRALRTGIGFFRGIPEVFKTHFGRNQVFAITDFDVSNDNTVDASKRYAEAIHRWIERSGESADLFFVIHEKTSPWEEDTPYHACKALLLEHGILSQNVTTELIRSRTQFEWSAANIALAAFSKLGGVPWAIRSRSEIEQLVLGVGIAESVDPKTRQRNRVTAFTTCMRTNGIFKFVAVGHSRTANQYLSALREAVAASLKQLRADEPTCESLVIHLPKDFGKAEQEQVELGLTDSTKGQTSACDVLKITDEHRLFVIDNEHASGVPNRGTCARIRERDYLLYTEGRDEKLSWMGRAPSALRIRRYEGKSQSPLLTQELISQVFDLSQANWRGFNARSRPVSILYSELIARELAYAALGPHGDEPIHFDSRLWFL